MRHELRIPLIANNRVVNVLTDYLPGMMDDGDARLLVIIPGLRFKVNLTSPNVRFFHSFCKLTILVLFNVSVILPVCASSLNKMIFLLQKSSKKKMYNCKFYNCKVVKRNSILNFD